LSAAIQHFLSRTRPFAATLSPREALPNLRGRKPLKTASSSRTAAAAPVPQNDQRYATSRDLATALIFRRTRRPGSLRPRLARLVADKPRQLAFPATAATTENRAPAPIAAAPMSQIRAGSSTDTP